MEIQHGRDLVPFLGPTPLPLARKDWEGLEDFEDL